MSTQAPSLGSADGDGAPTAERRLPVAIAPGERIYAIGDVHGRQDLFERILQRIRLDAAGRPPAPTRLVILGDLVDRGPGSAEVLRSAVRYNRASERFVVLMGNHEQLMAKALEGDLEAMALWLNVGGVETLTSFGVEPALVREGACARLLAAAQRQIGPDIVAWLLRLPLTLISGGVLFVHAGVRPGVPIDRQDSKDLLWIRDDFICDTTAREVLVVHGHTVFPDGPDWGHWRIGVDTGAYKTGRLSAIGLEKDRAWQIVGSDEL